jgi:hypothetical protein
LTSSILKNKIEKDNFRENHKKQTKKIMWRKTVAINNVLKKKITKLNYQPT